jgi:putative flippase GtrA
MMNFQKVKELYYTHQQLARYFLLAAILVSIEYFSYLLMLWAGINYLFAVVLSMGVVIILNWYLSRVLVFKKRRHSTRKEFILVLITSLVGVAFQLGVSFMVVSVLGWWPAIGKLLAIIVTFFWNYWVRNRYIF